MVWGAGQVGSTDPSGTRSITSTYVKRYPLEIQLCMVGSVNGAKMVKSKSVPIFILRPYEQVLHNTGSSHDDIQCLENILKKDK
jgi:hypothetical protein